MSAERELYGIVREIELVEEDIRDRNRAKSDIYKEAAAKGYDKKAIRQVVAARRVDPSDREQQDSTFDFYMQAVERAEKGLTHAREENIEKFGADRAPKSGTVPAVSVSGNDSRGPEVSTPSAGASVEPLQPAPLLPAATDGSPGIPSSDADAGKNGGGGKSSPERVAEQAEHGHVQSEHAVKDFEPPAFLSRQAYTLRPHCQNPDECGGYGTKHCHACLAAAGLAGVAA